MIFLEYLGAELSTKLVYKCLSKTNIFFYLSFIYNVCVYQNLFKVEEIFIYVWYVGPLSHKTDKCNSSADAERIKTADFGFTITKRGIGVQNKKKTSYSMHLA